MDYEKIIQYEAGLYDISEDWVKAIIQQESDWNKYAVRYEPKYEYLYQPEYYAHKLGVTLDTEINTQKMSFGLGQIMLALAREQGHKGYAGELFEPEINIAQVTIRLRTLKKMSATEDDVFAMYNGGPGAIHKVDGKYRNQAYVDSVKNHLKSLKA